MSTYSHLSVIKINLVKNNKPAGKRKSRKPGYGITSPQVAVTNNSLNMWYSNKAYPVLAD